MKTVKFLRILVQLAMFGCANLFFFGLAGGLGLIVKVQLLPAVLAMNLVVMAVVLGLTFLLGRVYCSTVCPMGAVQDAVLWMRRRLVRKGSRIVIAPVRNGRVIRAVALVVSIALIALGFVSLGALFDGYSLYGRVATAVFLPLCQFAQNAVAALQANGGHPYLFREEIFVRGASSQVVAGVGLAGVVVLAWFRGRWFCNALCPVGAALSFAATRPVVKLAIRPESCVSCGLCASACAAGAIDVKTKTVDNAACVRCLNCLAVCRKDALRMGGNGMKTNRMSSCV